MKWIVALLVVLNVAYFAWRFQARQVTPAAALAEQSEAGAVSRLLLLGEVDDGELRERVYSLEPEESVTDPVVTVVEAAADGEDAAVAGAEPAAAAAAAFVAAPDGRLCYSVGPLMSVEEVDAMSTWLAAQGGESVLRKDERRELALYWVYFPPLEGRAAAAARVERMRGQGIDDIYIIPRGDMALAISLGVYSRRISLERRLQQLRSKGYDPAVAPRYRNTKASWFDVVLDAGFDFQSSGFSQAFPTAEMSPGNCGDGAEASPVAAAPDTTAAPALSPPRPISAPKKAPTPVAPAASPPRAIAEDTEVPHDREDRNRPYVFSGPARDQPARQAPASAGAGGSDGDSPRRGSPLFPPPIRQ